MEHKRTITKVAAKTCLAISLIAFGSVLGFVETAGAEPTESQRLRGLGARVFLVIVQQVAGFPFEPEPYQNCYVFEPDGVWYESAPSPNSGGQTEGIWTQDSIGASTSYGLVDALGNGFLPVEQDGHVTPARGSGVLQLVANTTVDVSVFGLGFLEFLAVGSEIDLESARAGACPGEIRAD